MNYTVVSFNDNIVNNVIEKWSAFVSNHAAGNVFQTPAMFYTYLNTPNYNPTVFICFDENDDICGVLLNVVQKEYRGLVGFLTARSIINGGPLLKKDNPIVLNLLINSYNRSIRQKVIYSQIRNFELQESFKKDVFKINRFIFEDHLNILINLNQGKEKVWEGFSKSRKKGIKKATKYNFIFETTSDLSIVTEFYSLLKASYKKIGLPIPRIEHFYSLCNNLPKENYSFFSLKQNNGYVVVMLALIYKKTIYGYYMGTTNNEETFQQKPLDLFFWEIFNWSIRNELMFFDWMGAGKPNKSYGVRDFKKQFGGELINPGRYERIHFPILYNFSRGGLLIWKKIK